MDRLAEVNAEPVVFAVAERGGPRPPLQDLEERAARPYEVSEFIPP